MTNWELHGLVEGNLDMAPAEIERPARSPDVQDRQIGCELVAHLAVGNPNPAFPLWLNLVRDPNLDVQDEATLCLVKHLGVLALDPVRVVELVEAYNEAQRARYRR